MVLWIHWKWGLNKGASVDSRKGVVACDGKFPSVGKSRQVVKIKLLWVWSTDLSIERHSWGSSGRHQDCPSAEIWDTEEGRAFALLWSGKHL